MTGDSTGSSLAWRERVRRNFVAGEASGRRETDSTTAAGCSHFDRAGHDGPFVPIGAHRRMHIVNARSVKKATNDLSVRDG
jgi:hypothetical protein